MAGPTATSRFDWTRFKMADRVVINGPSLEYDGNNLPADDDPGWQEWELDGGPVRAIEVHGPFRLPYHGVEQRCEDGWIVLFPSGAVTAVESEYVTEGGIARAQPIGLRKRS